MILTGHENACTDRYMYGDNDAVNYAEFDRICEHVSENLQYPLSLNETTPEHPSRPHPKTLNRAHQGSKRDQPRRRYKKALDIKKVRDNYI
jgi:hypothetical protein